MADTAAPLKTNDDHNLLFAILALQADVIDREQFIEACTLWASQKQMALAELLLERGWITAEDRTHVEYLIERKLHKHGGAALASVMYRTEDQVRQSLAGIQDPELQSTLNESPPPQGRVLISTIMSSPGNRGRYTLTRLHAQGGIGQVWLARDTTLGREVALKELRVERVGNPDMWARFLKEAQITGQLEHPSIVPVYELAASADGVNPFYTMRFVRGRTFNRAIRAYHESQQDGEAGTYGLRELLTRFVAVCQALAYAHSRGVLHRDLKPQNIVLGDFGEVMVLDWGLAKVVGQADVLASRPLVLEGTGTSTETQAGSVLGTPAYMAPEQAEGRLDLLDERTDIYGLGAILYELLTGEAPFAGTNTPEVLEKVRQDTPARPRSIEPSVSPALEAICQKAMAKAREDRYTSVKEMSEEIQHWLADDPVSAYPEPVPMRLSRWVRRHRTLAATAAVLLATAAVGLGIGTVVLGQANARTHVEWQRAEENRVRAEEEKQHAEENRRKAERAAAKSEAINKFLTEDLLAAPRLEVQGKDVTVRAALNNAVESISPAFAEQPEVEVAVRLSIGETYASLGLSQPAEAQIRHALRICEKVLGPDAPETLTALQDLAMLAQADANLDEAMALAQRSLEGRRRILGAEHPSTLSSMLTVGQILLRQGKNAEAGQLLRETLQARRRVSGREDRDTLVVASNLGRVLLGEDRLPEAETLIRQTLEAERRVLGPDHAYVLNDVNNLAVVLKNQGKLSEAEPLYRENLAAYRRVMGAEHPYTLNAVNNLAGLLHAQGNYAEEEPLLRQNLEIKRRILGPKNPDTILAMEHVGMLLQAQKKLSEAEPLFRQSLDERRSHEGPENPTTLRAVIRYASLRNDQGKPAEAEALLRPNQDVCKRVLGAEHIITTENANQLAQSLAAQGKRGDAEGLWREVITIRRKKLPVQHPSVVNILASLGAVLVAEGKAQDAEPFIRDCLTARQKTLPPGNWQIASTECLLGNCLGAQRKFEDAEKLLLAGCEKLCIAKDAPPARKQEVLEQLAKLYEAWGKPDKASLWREKGKAALNGTQPPQGAKP